LQTPISVATFKDDLIRACLDYKAVFEKAEAAKKAQAAAVGTYTSVPPRASSGGDTSRRASSELVSAHQLTQSNAQVPSADTSKKRARSPDASTPTAQSSLRLSSSPTLNQLQETATERLDDQQREGLVDKYIALQTEEEELDEKIAHSKEERSNIAAQIVDLQARLNATTDDKSTLMEWKDKIRAEKRRLQSALSAEERLDFGFEAGRRMESKRAKYD
jgi:chromosome segregation ATPase